MDRRATLSTLLGRAPKTSTSEDTIVKLNSGLDPYTGVWNFEQASHLLRRVMFGPTYAHIKDAVQNGMDQTIADLLAPQSLPGPPLNYDTDTDPNVPIGSTWVNAPYSLLVNLIGPRFRSLRSWTAQLLADPSTALREKMVLFWHNHFVIASQEVSDAKFIYHYSDTIRKQALGNFRQLVKDITIDPSMLRYLNGNQNTKNAPNENYARELLELFTVGKGDIAGPGDYTTFTEQDVIQMARILTGWRDRGYRDVLGTPVSAEYVPNRHDTGDKQLSHRFNNTIVTNADDQEYANLIDIIFMQDEVARFISRKLYRWFVYYDIDSDTETNVIEPMAQLLINNDYEIQPVVEALLKSEHFYDILSMGPMIKNPIDFTMSVMNQFEVEVSSDLNKGYRAWLNVFNVQPAMQMEYYNPPDVAGWKAYYQEPLYYRTWINSVTLPIRMAVTDLMSLVGMQVAGETVIIDVLAFIEKIDNPLDPNAVVEEFANILFPRPIAQNQKDFLKSVLIPGLPDFEWTVEYSDYLSNPTDPGLKAAVESKLRFLVRVMLGMPEFYLS